MEKRRHFRRQTFEDTYQEKGCPDGYKIEGLLRFEGNLTTKHMWARKGESSKQYLLKRKNRIILILVQAEVDLLYLVLYWTTIRTSCICFEPVYIRQEQNQFDAELVHLVRDPRGVVYSRVKLGWMKKNFNSPEFRKSVRNIFDPILQNIRLGLFSCPSWLGDRFKVVRYEDIVANMLNVTRDLYKFAGPIAGLGWSSNVVEWISILSLRTADVSPRSSPLRGRFTKRPSVAMSEEKRLPFAG